MCCKTLLAKFSNPTKFLKFGCIPRDGVDEGDGLILERVNIKETGERCWEGMVMGTLMSALAVAAISANGTNGCATPRIQIIIILAVINKIEKINIFLRD